jgi:hypothetical protein
MYYRVMILAALMGDSICLAQTNAHRPLNVNGGTVVVRVSPTTSPSTLLQLIQRSPLIVDGTVISRMPTITTSSAGQTPKLETHSIVAVSAVLRGTVPNSSANILLAQAGGTSGNWNITAKGDPLVAPGERYILFLVSDERSELPNTSGMPRYATTGVWSGKVSVAAGNVAFPAAAKPGLHTYDNMSVDAFLQLLRDRISHPYTNTQLPINLAPLK